MKIGLRVNKAIKDSFVCVDDATFEIGIGGGQIASALTTHEPNLSNHHSNFVLEGAEMIKIKQATKEGFIEMEEGGIFDASYPESNTRRGRCQENGTVSLTLTAQNNELYRIEKPIKIGNVSNDNSQAGSVYSTDGISQTLCAGVHGYSMGNIFTEYRIRKLTPLECFRLMGVTDSDGAKMLSVNSNSQCYRQAGNSIVVDVMAAMFKQLFN